MSEGEAPDFRPGRMSTADHSRIAWCDATWNPVSGCSKVSSGCAHCYAEAISHRFGWTTQPWAAPHAADNVRCHADRLDEPRHWRRPRRVFGNSMSDLFHDQVPDSFLDQVFAVMALTPRHTFQILTKRPQRMRDYLMDPQTVVRMAYAIDRLDNPSGRDTLAPVGQEAQSWPLPNVWLGVSVEDQRRANERIPLLLQTPAALRFVSCEPLLDALDLTEINGESALDPICWGDCACDSVYGYDPGCVRHGGAGHLTRHIDWVIVGAESGSKARPMEDDWVRSLRDQCIEANVSFFFKQRVDTAGHKDQQPVLDGHIWKNYPAAKLNPLRRER